MAEHVRLKCDSSHCTGNCNACNLFICKVCGCAEGTLPDECPGEIVLYETEQLIYAGKLNYRDGMWREGEMVTWMAEQKKWNDDHQRKQDMKEMHGIDMDGDGGFLDDEDDE